MTMLMVEWSRSRALARDGTVSLPTQTAVTASGSLGGQLIDDDLRLSDLESLVLTGGLGERSARARRDLCVPWPVPGCVGLRLDEAAKAAPADAAAVSAAMRMLVVAMRQDPAVLWGVKCLLGISLTNAAAVVTRHNRRLT